MLGDGTWNYEAYERSLRLVRRLSKQYYERAGAQGLFGEETNRVEVPTAPWSEGDSPVEGRVHIDIYVYGETCVLEKELDDEYRNNPNIMERLVLHRRRRQGDGPGHYVHLRDPSALKFKYEGIHVDGQQDGLCPFLKWKACRPENAAAAEEAIAHSCGMAARAVRNAKNSPPVRRRDEHGNFVEVHTAALAAVCKVGRHRSTMYAKDTARRMRRRGCTVKIHYATLYRGVIKKEGDTYDFDSRGPVSYTHLTLPTIYSV